MMLRILCLLAIFASLPTPAAECNRPDNLANLRSIEGRVTSYAAKADRALEILTAPQGRMKRCGPCEHNQKVYEERQKACAQVQIHDLISEGEETVQLINDAVPANVTLSLSCHIVYDNAAAEVAAKVSSLREELVNCGQ